MGRRAVHALIAEDVAAEEKPPGTTGIGCVCRIHGCGIFQPLGARGHPSPSDRLQGSTCPRGSWLFAEHDLLRQH